jgi:hypothetical protein
MKRILLVSGLLILFAGEILRVYFIMPFPGSQQTNSIATAYWINNNIARLRIVAILLLILPFVNIYTKGKTWQKSLLAGTLVVYAIVFYFINFRLEADRMFYQPQQKLFTTGSADTTDRKKLVIGIAINGEAKAYPIQVIGYHHQVRDTIGNVPVMVTYCTVCRTGRTFSPFVNGKMESFRLVGMDHFNAMFEDAATKSWWQQATGVAITGPMKGSALKEVPSRQMTLASWLREYPGSLVLQPDRAFLKKYRDLAGYDNGTIKGGLEKRDSGSWKPKSWIIGIATADGAKAYDWNRLVATGVINDSVAAMPVVLTLESDTATFHAFDRRVAGKTLTFRKVAAGNWMDNNTNSEWDADGLCTSGPLKGQLLGRIQSYQEFWHSWNTFHPNTLRYLQ